VKVLIDLLRWGEGGTQTYARQVIPRLMEALPEAVLLAEENVARQILAGPALNDRVVFAPAYASNPYWRHLFQRNRIPRILVERNIDVYFVPGELSGLRRISVPRVRVVKMFRNMLSIDGLERRRFSIVRDFGTRFRLELLARRVLESLSAADRVVFVSGHSRDAVTSQTKIADHRLVYHPAPALPLIPVDAALKPKGPDRVVLYVSPTDPYKRQLEAIAGFVSYRRKFNDSYTRLALAGPVRGTYGRQTLRAASRAGDAVRVLGALPYGQLLESVQRADILLFGSTCECCPNVLLEYLAAGRPIVCSNAAPMPEIADNAAAYFSPDRPDSLSDALHRVLTDSLYAAQLLAAARERCDQFSLTKSVAATIEALTVW